MQARSILLTLAVANAAGSLVGQDEKVDRKPQIEWLHALDAALPKGSADRRPVILYFTFDT